jgi:hypothetical protein
LFSGYAEFGVAEIDVGAVCCENGVDLDGVTREDLVLETHIVDACVECELARKVVLHQKSTTLGHNLAKDDAWHHWVAREMSLEEELIASDVIFRMGDMLVVDVDLVDEQHRLAVR